MFEGITRSFTIGFTMRSGSNAICELLGRNRLGAPNEWFQNALEVGGGETWLQAFSRVVDRFQIGGVFGSKMSHDHRARLDENLRAAIPGYRRLDDVLPAHRWVWLVRKDKVLQAISLCRAESSGQFAITESGPRASGDYHYDFCHVLSRLLMLQGGEIAWELYFQEHGIEPFVIVYEEFFQDPERELPKLIDYLGGLPPDRATLDMTQTYKIQRDEVNLELRKRFVSDFSRVGEDSFAQEMGEPYQKWTRFFVEQRWRTLPATAGRSSAE